MLKVAVSLVASSITICAMRMAGRNDQRFNILGLVNCCIWTLFTVITASWGLMLLNVTLCYTYIQNLRRWRRLTMEQGSLKNENGKIVKDATEPGKPKTLQPVPSTPVPLRANQCRVCGSVTGQHGFSFST